VGPPAGRVSTALRAASVMYVVLGLGFGVGTAITLESFARKGELHRAARRIGPISRTGLASWRRPDAGTAREFAMSLSAAVQGDLDGA
jgi:hypothetical protein